jgi:hypothetical protein
LEKASQHDVTVRDEERGREAYGGPPEYYDYLIKEKRLFSSMYGSQYIFWLSVEGIKDVRRNRLPIFFRIASALLLVNGLVMWLNRNEETASY